MRTMLNLFFELILACEILFPQFLAWSISLPFWFPNCKQFLCLGKDLKLFRKYSVHRAS